MVVGTKEEAAREGFVYIAGPYRSKNGWCGVETNINTARFWAKQIAEADIPMFCPHLNSAHFEDIAPSVQESYWLRMDFVILSHANGIFMLPNWDTSSGAVEELHRATTWGIPDYYAQATGGVDGLAELVDDWKWQRIQVETKEMLGV